MGLSELFRKLPKRTSSGFSKTQTCAPSTPSESQSCQRTFSSPDESEENELKLIWSPSSLFFPFLVSTIQIDSITETVPQQHFKLLNSFYHACHFFSRNKTFVFSLLLLKNKSKKSSSFCRFIKALYQKFS